MGGRGCLIDFEGAIDDSCSWKIDPLRVETFEVERLCCCVIPVIELFQRNVIFRVLAHEGFGVVAVLFEVGDKQFPRFSCFDVMCQSTVSVRHLHHALPFFATLSHYFVFVIRIYDGYTE